MSNQPALRRPWALPLVLAGVVVACDPAGGPRVGSQTNWLQACRSDADCGDLACHCGACTRSCSSDESCASLSGSVSCVPADDRGAIALCGGDRPSSPGFCLPSCDAAGCPDGTACVAGVCSPLPEPTGRVTIDTSTRYQSLVGFGAAIGYVQHEIARHPRKTALLSAMFAESGIDVLRLENLVGFAGEEDLSDTIALVEAAAEGLGREPTIMLTSWSPPPNLKASGSIVCEGNPDTCTLARAAGGEFDYAGLADHWRASLEAYAEAGIEPVFIGVQNNPNWVPPTGQPTEACRFLPTEGTAPALVGGDFVEVEYPGLAEAITAVAGRLEGLASVPGIVAPEVTAVEYVAEYVSRLDFSDVAAITHHFYGADPTAVDVDALAALGELGERHGRPLLQTEMTADGFGTAVLMHYALVVEGASAYLQNEIVGTDPPSAGSEELISLTAQDFAVEDPYFAMRHYAIHTDPGWVRVAATADVDGLLASAWSSPAEDALTVVLVNPGLSEIATELEFGEESMAASEVTRTVFDGVERSAELGDLSAAGILRVPARSVVTVALER
ncbi:MAG: hypothetical protein JW751_09915 [Polyangiaceae bacterium]|nr:hypothetical protein [Polyangiaceae bacterium]